MPTKERLSGFLTIGSTQRVRTAAVGEKQLQRGMYFAGLHLPVSTLRHGVRDRRAAFEPGGWRDDVLVGLILAILLGGPVVDASSAPADRQSRRGSPVLVSEADHRAGGNGDLHVGQRSAVLWRTGRGPMITVGGVGFGASVRNSR